nr:MAG TPA: Protein of unknown function (DUF1351) [Caudoviricetes sp.]
MQLEIYSPTQAQPLPPVEWNYAELKQWVSDGLEAYRGRVYTEDTVTEAKRDRATLNKLAQAIEDRRREMKAVYLAPYDQFEKQAKELVEMVKNQSREIDAQIKTYDRQRREEKLARIKIELYAPMIGDLAEAIPYEKLHDPKWLNVTVSMTAVSEALAAKIESIRSGFAALHKLDVPPDVLHQIHAEFAKDFDLAAAIAAKDRILEEKKHMLEFSRHLEAQSAASSEETSSDMEQPPAVEKAAEVRKTPTDDEPVMQLDFRAWVTRSQMLALREFLNTNNIKYGKVPRESEE